MLGVEGAAIIAVFNLLLAGLLGIGVGYLICKIRRQHWGIKVAAIDGLLAIVIAVIVAYVAAAIETALGIWASNVTLAIGIALAVVVVRHFWPQRKRSVN
jgi:peptidoglycan/LPS O-acetylase OafA/YrhL